MVTLIDTFGDKVQYGADLTPNELIKAMNIAKKNIPDLYFNVCQKVPNLSTIVKENSSKINSLLFEYIFGNKININFHKNTHIKIRTIPKNFLNRKTLFIDFLYGNLGKTEDPQLARVYNSINKNLLDGNLFLDYDNPLKLIVFKPQSDYGSNKTLEYRHKLKDLFLKL